MNHDAPRGPAFYEHFFKFHRPPFSLAPDTRFRFQSASHAAALEQITYALQRREPIIVVTGEIGTGKTLLCRTVVEQSDRKTFVSIINDPHLGADDLLKRMLEDFGVISKDRTVMTPTSRHDLVHALQEFVASLGPIQAHAAVIIDEAQHMQPDVLEQIRLVANIQDERGTLLQMILVGQTDIEKLLAQPSLRQLAQRVSRFVRLDPLSADELAKYIQHRLGVAREQPLPANFPGAHELERELAQWDGAKPDFPFTPDAVAAIGRISHGIPRVVNLLCDRALEAAYGQRMQTVDGATIQGAARALGLPADTEAGEVAPLPVWQALDGVDAAAEEPVAAAPSRSWRNVLLAALIVVAAAAAWFAMRGLSPSAPTAPASSAPAAPPVRPQSEAPAPSPPGGSSGAPAAAPAREPTAAPPTTAPATAAPGAAPSSAPAAAPSAAPARASGAATPPGGAGAERFEIVVASFRTETRANDVAAAIAALPEPVRQRNAGGWQQVLAGPYASADQARAAQQRLERAGFTGTHVTPVAR